jgi:hypothetical protein
MTRFIFITGGVVSSLGKGIASAALGALLQARGYKVRLRKLDPYINVDTSPTTGRRPTWISAITSASPAWRRGSPTMSPRGASIPM